MVLAADPSIEIRPEFLSPDIPLVISYSGFTNGEKIVVGYSFAYPTVQNERSEVVNGFLKYPFQLTDGEIRILSGDLTVNGKKVSSGIYSGLSRGLESVLLSGSGIPGKDTGIGAFQISGAKKTGEDSGSISFFPVFSPSHGMVNVSVVIGNKSVSRQISWKNGEKPSGNLSQDENPEADDREYGVMKVTPDLLRAQMERDLSVPILPDAPLPSEHGNKSLLNYLPNIPDDRIQGSCGNCWVWGATAVLEIAHTVQNGIFDRLSIQYFNSNYHGGKNVNGTGFACTGGGPGIFADFYRTPGYNKAIPWSNTNASYADVWCDRNCTETAMPAKYISEVPSYPIRSIEDYEVSTRTVTNEQAIANIKAQLNANIALNYMAAMPNATVFNKFWNYFSQNYSSEIWDPDLYSDYDEVPNYSHYMTLVGYNDTSPDPDEWYWIILNSWGVFDNRPDGLFRLKMNMNYSGGGLTPFNRFFGFNVSFKEPELPGNFSISTIEQSGGTTGLFPSLVVNGKNGSYISYFSSPSQRPWTDGTTGSIRLIRMNSSVQPVTMEKEKTVVNLVYRSYPEGTQQPEWGRTSLGLDSDNNPVIAYNTVKSGDYIQTINISYGSGDGWHESFIDMFYPWSPSVAVPERGFPTLGYISGTSKNVRFAYNPGKDYTQPWNVADVIPPKGDWTNNNPWQAYLTHLYTGQEKTARMFYYDISDRTIRHSWMPDNRSVDNWNVEPVIPEVSAGWVSAAFDPDSRNLGVCWYDPGEHTLKFIEKPAESGWGLPERVDTGDHDVGSNCSLAYGPASGAVPGPGISYYDATIRSLIFAWRDEGGWHTTRVDSGGAGTSSSLGYTSDGYPVIAYRHEDSNALKIAHMTKGAGISASFTSDVQTGNVPLTVRFSDTSGSTALLLSPVEEERSDSSYGIHYWWDLNGDGTWEEEDNPNPVYTYTRAGSYNVRMLIHIRIPLIFSDLDLWGIADKEDYIRANGTPEANFSANPLSGTPPLPVHFTDASGGDLSSWNWTFGDGTVSHDQNPDHTFTGTGRYTVTLERSGSSGSAIARKPGMIDVSSGNLTGPAGMLKISSEPGDADIFIDSVYQGVTPVDSLVVRAGAREIRIHKDGYRDWAGTVRVTGDTVTVIPRVRLWPVG
jgi:PKD repeat protein